MGLVPSDGPLQAAEATSNGDAAACGRRRCNSNSRSSWWRAGDVVVVARSPHVPSKTV